MQNPTPMSSPPVMQPRPLDFTNSQSYSNMLTPQSSRSTQSRTPITLTPTFSDNSPQTSENSSFTPSLSGLKLGKGHGHTHVNKLWPPHMMISLMEEVMSIKRNGLNDKTTEMWRFQKLMSGKSAEYRKNEKERALRYYYEKKASRTGGEGFEGIDQLPDDDFERHDDEYRKSLSRQR